MQPRKRRTFLVGCCTVALLGAVACKSSRKQQGPQATEQSQAAAEASSGTLKPINIVFVTLDTVRADHLHCYGYAKIKTPTLDAIAKNGVLFEKAVAQAPLTLPSHASMFTGTNPNVHHVRDTGGFVLQPSSVTMATILEKHGWNTAAFVSSFVFKRVFGFNQGFSFYDDRMPGGAGGESGTRTAGVTVDHALAWLKTQSAESGKPFFVWLHFYDAHQPYVPPPAEFQRQYPGDTYDAEIAYVDQQLGRFLDAVRKTSPPQKTLIVVLSDHGESLGDHGEYQHGIFLYDSTIRIAWVMSGPGIPAGVRVAQQARTIDLLPTVLDLLGGRASSVVQGTSLVPAFSGKSVPTTYSYEETMYPKFIMNWSSLRGIHTADWMYVRAPKPELYDLKSDPGELHNVIVAYPKEYRELDKQLKLLIGNNGTEKVVSQQMDQQTMERLRSLGYLGGSSQQAVNLDSTGPDPKDHVDILKLIHEAKDSPPDAISSSRRIELYQEALKKDPTNPSIYYDLGDEYEKTGQIDANLQLCLDAIHHGVTGSMILSRLGQLYLSKGDARQAIEYYQSAVQLNPIDAQTMSGLGSAYSANGQLAEAAAEFQRVLAIEPYIPAYNGLGLVAVKQHDLVSARKNFERAVHLDGKDAESQLNLGVLCMQTGDVPCGRAAFHAFLANASPVQFKDMIPRVQYALRTVLATKP
ncbi:MAG: sulfatase-like hydrolase/transferase [Acidobacteriaceae bacterium]